MKISTTKESILTNPLKDLKGGLKNATWYRSSIYYIY